MRGAACRNETHSPVNNLSSLSNNRFPSSNIAKSPSGRALTAGFPHTVKRFPAVLKHKMQKLRLVAKA